MLPLAIDQSLNEHIVRGLRRRAPDIDLVLVRETHLDGRPDPEVLEWAAAEGRILVAQDKNTMVGFAYDRMNTGQPMPGLIIRGNNVSIRQAIDDLLIVAQS